MIPVAFIAAWKKSAPWTSTSQVEQDLVISRTLVEMFKVPQLKNRLLFRGGTALYKLHLSSAPRFSEDIDLVQRYEEPIGETLDLIQSVLNTWLGKPKRQFHEGRVNLVYRYFSEEDPSLQLRLKIEINTREHFNELPLEDLPFSVGNQWFKGEAVIQSYSLEEMLGTKLRALYQRKKGRDLFDLWYALETSEVDVNNIVRCFRRYMSEEQGRVTRAMFEKNLMDKQRDPDFISDVFPILRTGIQWNIEDAVNLVQNSLLAMLSGEPFQSR